MEMVHDRTFALHHQVSISHYIITTCSREYIVRNVGIGAANSNQVC